MKISDQPKTKHVIFDYEDSTILALMYSTASAAASVNRELKATNSTFRLIPFSVAKKLQYLSVVSNCTFIPLK